MAAGLALTMSGWCWPAPGRLGGIWGTGAPHGLQEALKKQPWHLEHPAQPWPGQHPGVLRAAPHLAVPTDPGTPKQCWGPRMTARVGLGPCPHPCKRQKWGCQAQLRVPEARLEDGGGLDWDHLDQHGVAGWCRTGPGMPGTGKDWTSGALPEPGLTGLRMPGMVRDWAKSALPEPGVRGTKRRRRGRCPTEPRVPGTEPEPGPGPGALCPKRRCRVPDRERRGRRGAGPWVPGADRTGMRGVPGVRGVAASPAPRLWGRGRTTCRPPRPARRPAPAPPRCRRRSQRGSAQHGGDPARPAPPRRCLLPALRPARYRGRPPEGYRSRGGGATRGGPAGLSAAGSAAPGAAVGAAPGPGLLRPPVGLWEGGGGDPSPGDGNLRGAAPRAWPRNSGEVAAAPAGAQVKGAQRCSGRGEWRGGRHTAGQAPRSRQQRGRPPRPCPYKAAVGSAGPAGAAPRPGGEREEMRGEGSSEPGGTRPPAAIQPCEPPPAPTLQLLGASEPLRSVPPRGPRTKPELCRLPAGTGRPSRRAAGEEAMPVCGTEQEPDPGSISRAVFRLCSTSNMSPRGQAQTAAWR